jgi:O-antigen ligase
LFQNASYETILKHPLTGVGIGQFVASEYQIHPNLESWQYQPVHNVYFLLFSELGIVGLIFFLLWIFSILEWGSGKNRNTGLLHSLLLTRLSIYCIILSFLFIAFFDHYFWDITLGTLIFVLPLILVFIFVLNSKKCSTDFFGLL